jgi:glycine oxidase
MKQRVVIIGAGAVGCLSALALHQRGLHVTLVDKGELGSESSWAGGGILFPLLPWKYTEPVTRLALAGAAAYQGLCEELRQTTGIDPQYRVSGMLAFSDFGGTNALDWCRQHGIAAEIQDNGLWLPNVAQARNPRLMQAMRAILKMRGVHLVEQTELVPLQQPDGTIDAWHSSDGRRFEADAFVVTAGAWSSKLLGTQALDVQIKPMRGQMLLYKLMPGVLKHILYHEDFYLIPRTDGHILAGSTVEDVGFDKSTTPQAAADLHRKASQLLPALGNAAVIKHWSGLRPGSPDNVPIIARHPAFDNLWLNSGHFRYGVTMAPASAEILADLMQGRSQPVDYAYAVPLIKT